MRQHRLRYGVLALLMGVLTLAGLPGVLSQPTPAVPEVGIAFDHRPRAGSAVVSVDGLDLATITIELTGGQCPTEERAGPVDVVMVLDVSGSMNTTTSDGVRRIDALRDSAGRFVNVFFADALTNQMAIVTFDDTPETLTNNGNFPDRDPQQSPFLNNPVALLNIVSTIDEDGGTNIDAGIDMASDIFAGPYLNPNAAPVLLLMTDAETGDTDEVIAAAQSVRRRTPSLRIIAIGLGITSGSDAGNLLTEIADEAYFIDSAADLGALYERIANQIQPRLYGEALTVTYTVNSAAYTLRPDSVSGGGRVTGSIITWTLDTLNADTTSTFTFDVQALGAGTQPAGTVEVGYSACGQPVITRAQGPAVVVIPPSPTPTPTSTPTPTATFTPSPTPTATLPAWTQPDGATTMPPPTAPGVTGILCGTTVFSWLPWLAALIALLIALFLLSRWLPRTGGGWRDWACFMLKAATLLYLVFLVFLFFVPVANAACPIPESVYFWRMDSSSRGIFITNEVNAGAPAQVESVNEVGCVGCHTVTTSGEAIAAMTGPLPGNRLLVRRFDGSTVNVPPLEGVYAAFSPDGTRLAVTTTDAELLIIELASGGVTPVPGATDATFGAMMPTWSADGLRIAYTRAARASIDIGLRAFDSSEIVIIDAAGGSPQPLVSSTTLPGINYYPAFSPDGRWLAFTHASTGSTYAAPNADIYLYDLTTSAAMPIALNDAAASDSWASWNRDGTRLAFNTTRFDPAFDIVIVDIAADGAASNLVLLPGASSPSVFEHLPFWGQPIARIDLLTEWGALLPWLLPLIPLLLLTLGCILFKPKKAVELTEDPLPNIRPLTPMQPQKLAAWKGMDRLWEPRPTLVIGLGRASWEVLTLLKKNMADANLGEPMQAVQMVALVAGSQKNLPNPDFSGLRLEPKEIVEYRTSVAPLIDGAASDEALKTWVNTNELRQRGEASFDPGAGGGFAGDRVLGRLALIQNLRGAPGTTVFDTLKAAITRVREAYSGESNRLNVFIVADLGDDIGSGQVFDIAYLAHRLQKESGFGSMGVHAHLLTVSVIGKDGVNEMIHSVNTAAALRELGRFQLASGAPFPMRYAASASTPTPFDGIWDRVLFDEVFVYDGQRAQSGVLSGSQAAPAIADAITVWIDDETEKGSFGVWRSTVQGATNETQRLNRQVAVSGLGIYQYRLPFADIINLITLRFAREVVQRLLMADGGGALAFDARLSKDRFGLLGSGIQARTAPELAAYFLRERFGSAPLPDAWRRLLIAASAEQIDSDEVNRHLRKASALNEDEQSQYAGWLRGMTALILNGQREAEEPDVLVKRGAKLALAIDFVRAMEGLLQRLQRQVQTSQPGHTVVAGLEALIAAGSTLKTELEGIGRGLGIGMAAESAYAQLNRSYDEIEARLKQFAASPTRKYVLRDEQGELQESWYKEYILGPQIDGVRMALTFLQWRQAGERGEMQLVLGREDGEIIFNPADPTPFAAVLTEMGRYFLRDVRHNKNLADILASEELHNTRLDTIAPVIEQASAPLLGVDPVKSPALTGSYILSVQDAKRGTVAALWDRIRSRVPQAARKEELPTSDPFTLGLMQRSDAVLLNAVRSLSGLVSRYTQTVYDARNPRSIAVFDAEANAMGLERSLAKIKTGQRPFHPVMTTVLAHPMQVQAFLLATVAATTGDDFTDWRDQRGQIMFSSQETGLLNNLHTAIPQYGQQMDALIRFATTVDDATAGQLLKRYEDDLANFSARLHAWSRAGGVDWRTRFADCGPVLVQDMIDLARLAIDSTL